MRANRRRRQRQRIRFDRIADTLEHILDVGADGNRQFGAPAPRGLVITHRQAVFRAAVQRPNDIDAPRAGNRRHVFDRQRAALQPREEIVDLLVGIVAPGRRVGHRPTFLGGQAGEDVIRKKCETKRDPVVARGGLDEHAREAGTGEQFAVGHAVQCDAAGQAKVRTARAFVQMTRDVRQRVFEPVLRRPGEIFVARRQLIGGRPRRTERLEPLRRKAFERHRVFEHAIAGPEQQPRGVERDAAVRGQADDARKRVVEFVRSAVSRQAHQTAFFHADEMPAQRVEIAEARVGHLVFDFDQSFAAHRVTQRQALGRVIARFRVRLRPQQFVDGRMTMRRAIAAVAKREVGGPEAPAPAIGRQRRDAARCVHGQDRRLVERARQERRCGMAEMMIEQHDFFVGNVRKHRDRRMPAGRVIIRGVARDQIDVGRRQARFGQDVVERAPHAVARIAAAHAAQPLFVDRRDEPPVDEQRDRAVVVADDGADDDARLSHRRRPWTRAAARSPDRRDRWRRNIDRRRRAFRRSARRGR